MSDLTQVGSAKPDSLEGRVFVGVVAANDDSQAADGKRRQRIKVFVTGVLDTADGYSVDTLPWCLPSAALSDYGPTWGAVDVPSIGSKVHITFQDGRLEFPTYSPGAVEDDPHAQLQPNYPNRRGRVLKNGAYTWIDETTGEHEYKLASGYRLYVDGSGNVLVEIPGNAQWIIGGDMSVTVGGNYDLRANGHVAETSGGDFSVSAGGSSTVQSVGEMHLTASIINENAG